MEHSSKKEAKEGFDAEAAVPDEPPESVEPGEASVEGRGLTDVLRKVMVAGLGSVFMSEGGVRALVKDLKLPKDVMGFMVGQAERSKAELFRVIGDELHRFFQSAALRGEVVKLLSDLTIEVNAEIRLRPDSKGGTEVKVRSATAKRGHTS